MDKKTSFNVWYLVAAMVGVMLLQSLWQTTQQATPIPYSQFESLLREG